MNVRILTILAISLLIIAGAAQQDVTKLQNQVVSLKSQNQVKKQDNIAPSNNKPTPLIPLNSQNLVITPLTANKQFKNIEAVSKDKKKPIQDIERKSVEYKNQNIKLQKKDILDKPQAQNSFKKDSADVQKSKEQQNNKNKQTVDLGRDLPIKIQTNSQKKSVVKNIQLNSQAEIKQIPINTQIKPKTSKSLNDQEETKNQKKTTVDIKSTAPTIQIPQIQTSSQQRDIAKQNDNLIVTTQPNAQNVKQKQATTSGVQAARKSNPQIINAAVEGDLQPEIKIIKIENKQAAPQISISSDSVNLQKQNDQKAPLLVQTHKNIQKIIPIQKPIELKKQQNKSPKQQLTSPIKNDNSQYAQQIDHRLDQIKIIKIQKQDAPKQSPPKIDNNLEPKDTNSFNNPPTQIGDAKNTPINQPTNIQNGYSLAEKTNNNIAEKTPNAPEISAELNKQSSSKQHSPSQSYYQSYKSQQKFQLNQQKSQNQPKTDLLNFEQKTTQKQLKTQIRDIPAKTSSEKSVDYSHMPVEGNLQAFSSPKAQIIQSSFKSQEIVINRKQNISNNLQKRTSDEKPSQKQRVINALVDEDPELPKDQNMDTQTIIILIVLTFIISIPVVRQIRLRGGQKRRKTDSPSLQAQVMRSQTSSGEQYTQIDNGTGLQIEV